MRSKHSALTNIAILSFHSTSCRRKTWQPSPKRSKIPIPLQSRPLEAPITVLKPQAFPHLYYVPPHLYCNSPKLSCESPPSDTHLVDGKHPAVLRDFVSYVYTTSVNSKFFNFSPAMGKGKDAYWAFLLFVLAMVLGLEGVQASSVRHYKWQVDYQFWSPDCVERVLIAINGQYPGPTIRARVGDTILVELENLMPTESVVIHWHGIRQTGTPWYDGAAFISQCPINPGEKFVYKFLVDKAGTFFYHGHHGLQRSAGLYGSLIVDLPHAMQEPFQYDGELSILLNDWFHKSAYEQGLGLFSNPFRWVGEPQSLLIEGRGQYNCSLIPGGAAGSGDTASCKASNPQCSPHVLPVEPGKTYRLRIASVASLSSLNFIIEGHKMVVVEADGNYVEPVELEDLDIYSGETFSVLLTADQDGSRNYWAGLNVRGRPPKTPTGLALLNYLPNAATLLPPTSPPVSPLWNDTSHSLSQHRLYSALRGHVAPPPPAADTRLLLLNTQNHVAGIMKWAINNVSLAPTPTPYLPALKYRLHAAFGASPPPATYAAATYDIRSPPPNPNATSASGVYRLVFNSTVDVVLQNANTLTKNNSEIHPWHLHGHDFWVLGYGIGVFDEAADMPKLNFENPPLKNTVPMFPYGWTAIRFRANNPGVWLFHCHVEPHFHMGMAIVFAAGVDRIGKLPRSTLGCGLTKKWLP